MVSSFLSKEKEKNDGFRFVFSPSQRIQHIEDGICRSLYWICSFLDTVPSSAHEGTVFFRCARKPLNFSMNHS